MMVLMMMTIKMATMMITMLSDDQTGDDCVLY